MERQGLRNCRDITEDNQGLAVEGIKPYYKEQSLRQCKLVTRVDKKPMDQDSPETEIQRY